ncbi:MAG: hypothetical protein WCK65_14720 [Rhodospirillaceae bacterium]
MTDRVKEIGHDPNFPLFTPAASPMFVRHCSASPTCRADAVNWYRDSNPEFSHPAALYSAGHAHLDLETSRKREGLITLRDRATTLLNTDSGGFQIGQQTMPGGEVFRYDIHGREADKLRQKNLTWSEAFGDYAITLDFPAWAVGTPNYLFRTADECLRETIYNLSFIRERRIPGRVKLLNVVQGRTYSEALRWYKSVKDFRFEGWSFAGPVAADPDITVKILLNMWRDRQINADQRWLHILGRSSLNAVWNNNIIHRCIRDFIYPDAQVSYDSSSAVQFAVNGTAIVGARINADEFAFDTQDALIARGDNDGYCRQMFANLQVQVEKIRLIDRLSMLSVAQLIETQPVPNINIRFKAAMLQVFERAAEIGIDRFPIDDVDLREFSKMVS